MSQVLDLRQFHRLSDFQNQTPENTLWYQGDLELLNQPLASVVGTREITSEGALRAKRLTSLLVSHGFCIVSGLAKGVDRVAHETALEMNGKTIAVMGTPIDQCYPREHVQLKAKIVERGLVLSQFAPGTPLQKSNFPRRNVLMAALSGATFVVEAEADSGTRHQVKAAISMGKPVGLLASLVQKGYPWIDEAIRSGHGAIIEHPEDARMVLSYANEMLGRRPTAHIEQEFLFGDFTAQAGGYRGIEAAFPEAPIFHRDCSSEEPHLALVVPSAPEHRSWLHRLFDHCLGLTSKRVIG